MVTTLSPARTLMTLTLVYLLVPDATPRALADAPPDATSGTPDPSTSASTRSGPSEPESVSARIVAGITRVAPGVATIRRSARDLLLSNLMVFARSMRALRTDAGEGVIGFRLYGIRAGSIAAALGLQNGDLLRSINGRPTTTPEEALAAYASLRGAASWSLRVHRRGQDTVLSVQVIDDATDAASDPATTGSRSGAASTRPGPASAP